MNFTNINDPAGVKALLDQLRVSQAWQEVTTSYIPDEVPPGSAEDQLAPSPAATSTSVASLLSQLHTAPSLSPPHSSNVDAGHLVPSVPRLRESTPSVVVPVLPHAKTDARSYTFQQALPVLAQLTKDSEFVEMLHQMKKEQDDLERQLCEDRRAIHKTYEEKVRIALTKANMTGDGKLSKHEADMIQTAFKQELDKFDRNRALLAWDGLISKHQTMLASHSVPAMFVSIEGADRDRQQRVIQVLENILGS